MPRALRRPRRNRLSYLTEARAPGSAWSGGSPWSDGNLKVDVRHCSQLGYGHVDQPLSDRNSLKNGDETLTLESGVRLQVIKHAIQGFNRGLVIHPLGLVLRRGRWAAGVI